MTRRLFLMAVLLGIGGRRFRTRHRLVAVYQAKPGTIIDIPPGYDYA